MRALLLAALLAAQPTSILKGRVTDSAEILRPETEATLTALLEAHETATTNQVAVLTVPWLGGEAIEPYAARVFNEFGLGRSDRDNGVLLLVARDDRELRIEVGYGVEDALTDAEAGRIIRHVIVPAFRRGDFDAGVTEGTRAILAEVEGVRFDGVAYSGVRALGVGDYVLTALSLLALWLALALGRGYVVKSGGLWVGARRWAFGWRAVLGGLFTGFALRTLSHQGEIVMGTPAVPLPFLLGFGGWLLVVVFAELLIRQSMVWQRFRRRQARIEKQKQRARQQGKRVYIELWGGRGYWYDGTPAPASSSSSWSSGSSGSSSSSSSSSFSSSSFSGGGGSSGGGGASGSW
ncbi:MAG TPA: TPM domain-containing protein [Rubricoccaceae bacterium]|nr:TPM domain-containing protein [Rubricoccaceae bacterium]